ncbi:alpha/beta fold hydrolase [Rhodospirillum centenum]|uniref:Hydrolase, alpha n=1 Tax=Rhodospirillum centenum (strain ATCC 51521 / SW) TaxID=414684 RepID=B6IT20_RHOCS|nr:alpha/beta fold hydrolase [Rhodospirillum centenum]ACI98778.1 hydrolase, alpha [Rhodospirillum centenum SW]
MMKGETGRPPETGALPLVLLPGLLCDATLWAHQTRHLADVAPDIRVADLTGAESVTELARGVLATAPERFALAGLSMGGYVAFEVLRQAPGRVAKLCLVDTTARPDTDEQKERRQALIKLAQTGRFKGVTPRLLPMLVHPDRLADTEVTEAIMAMAERTGRDAFCRQQTAILTRPDSRPDLPGIHCPTLVIVGREDSLTGPEKAQEMADGIPGGRLAVVERCGHLAPMEQPEATTALMRLWLTQL